MHNPDEPSVARGMAVVAAASLLMWWTQLAITFIPPAAVPPLEAVCSAYVEHHDLAQRGPWGEAPRPTLRCADAEHAASAGARRTCTTGGCTDEPGALRGSWRQLVGMPLNLNRASHADLRLLEGIGPKRAAAIVAYRQAHGDFVSVEQLRRVPGIGPARLRQMREHLAVEGR